MKFKSHAPRRVTPQQVAAFRLSRHHLITPDSDDAVAVCRDVCGIQAQLTPAAKLSIAARTRGLTPAAIESALWDSRTLVKALCMRQTVHLLPAAEFSLYLAAVRRSRVAAVVRIMERFGITARDMETLNRVTLELLKDGPLPLRELTSRMRPCVRARVRAWMDRVWNAARLALVEGLICYGPDRGQQVTFVRVDQWLPKQSLFDEGDAQRLLLHKFLGAYGPATLADFSKWSGIPVGEARPAWEQIQDDLAEVSVNGKRSWIVRRDLAQLTGSKLHGTVANLLPAFDTFLLAHAEKDHLVERKYYKRVYRSLGQISPVVLLNGRIVGTWERKARKGLSVVAVHSFGAISAALRDGVGREAARLGKFLDAECAVRFLPG